MAGAFGYGDAIKAAPAISMISGTVDDGMPLSNLYDAQPSLRTRFVNAGTVRFVVDFGVAVTAGLIILGNTTIDTSGLIRLYGSLTDPTGVAAEIFNRSASAPDPDRSRGQVVDLLPADVSFRYLRVHIENPPGGVIDVGFVAVMRTLRLAHGIALGAAEGRLGVGARDQNSFTGAEFGVPGVVQPRVARFSLPGLVASEYHGTLRSMLDDLDPAQDVAWLPDTGLAQAELNRRTIFGGVVRPGQELLISRDRPVRASASYAIIERV